MERKTQPFLTRLSSIPQLKSALALRAVHDIRNGIDARPTPAEVTAFGLRQEMSVIVAEASALRVRATYSECATWQRFSELSHFNCHGSSGLSLIPLLISYHSL